MSSAVVSVDPLSGADSGRLRWAVNSTSWQPHGEKDGAEFQFLLSLIRQDEDRIQVTKFLRFEDSKRALLSRLLVRCASAVVLGMDSFSGLQIKRTKGRKPFLFHPRPPESRPDLANFNFNVSHEGDWVVLASEPICVCGVDVAAPEVHRPGSYRAEMYRDFKDQLTEQEWRVVRQEAATVEPAPGEQPGYRAFQRFWSCKESFVKARGDGLGFELGRCSFTFANAAGAERTSSSRGSWMPCQRRSRDLEPPEDSVAEVIDADFVAMVAIDGQPAPEWRFFQHRLGDNHWVTVARGPTASVVDANGEFSATLSRATSAYSVPEWEAELSEASPPFVEVSVGFLVPSGDLKSYEQAGGRLWGSRELNAS